MDNTSANRIVLLVAVFAIGIGCAAVGGVSAQQTTSTGFVDGSVTDLSGNAIPEATVTATDDAGEVVTEVVTDDNGEFTMELAEGEYEILATASGYGSAITQVNLGAGQTEPVALSLEETATSQITGDIVNEDYENIPNAEVTLRDAETEETVATTMSGSQGSYTFVDLEPGEYQVEATVDGESGFANVDAKEGTNNQDIVITGTTTGSVTGDIVTVDDDNLPNAEVTLQDAETGETVATALSGPEGSYTFSDVEQGEYQLEATFDGASGSASITVEDGTTSQDIVIPGVDPATGSISVEVIGSNAQPVVGATVELYDGSSTLIDTAETNEAGEIEFHELAVGADSSNPVDYTVNADHPEYESTMSITSLYEPDQTSDHLTLSLTAEEDHSEPTEPVADMEIDEDTVPNAVSAGESFDVEFVVTNTGDGDADSGGIEFSTPSAFATDSVFFVSGLPAGESTTETVSFEVGDSVDSGEYSISAEALVGDSTDSVTLPVTIGEPTAELEVVSGPTPDPVTAGDSFTIDFAVKNTGEVDADSGGIQFTTPAGISATDSIFFTSGIEAGEQINETVTFDIDDSVDEGEYTISLDGTVGGDSDSVEQPIDVSASDELSRFDQDNSGTISFPDVISAIQAHNEQTEIGGNSVSFGDVLDVISTHNNNVAV